MYRFLGIIVAAPVGAFWGFIFHATDAESLIISLQFAVLLWLMGKELDNG